MTNFFSRWTGRRKKWDNENTGEAIDDKCEGSAVNWEDNILSSSYESTDTITVADVEDDLDGYFAMPFTS